MKRLRLIKPWKLRIQPQRLAYTAFLCSVSDTALPCAGPSQLDEEACSLRGSEAAVFNVRFSAFAGLQREAAPAPRPIFAPVPNERFRP